MKNHKLTRQKLIFFCFVVLIFSIIFNIAVRSPKPENNSESVSPASHETAPPVPDNWQALKIREYNISFSAPKNLYFTNPRKRYSVNSDNSYLLSDVPGIRSSYQDWANNEQLQIAFLFYNQRVFEIEKQNIINTITNGKRGYTENEFLVNNHKAVLFSNSTGGVNPGMSLISVELIELEKQKLLVVWTSASNNAPVDTIKTVLGSISVQ